MKKNYGKCPNCGSDEFVSLPNRYDILIFKDSRFQVVKSEFTNDEDVIYCRGCSERVNVEEFEKNNAIVLMRKQQS